LPAVMAADAAVLELAGGGAPSDVFRFTSPCQNDRCDHFREGQCSLPEFIRSHSRPSELKPGFCPIRPVCRWFHQLSYEACDRCAALVTGTYAVSGDELSGPLDESPDGLAAPVII